MSSENPTRLAVVGSFTTAEREARGKGLEVYSYAGEDRWRHVGGCDGLVNPSFLRASADGTVIYAAHGDQEFASAYKIDPASSEITVLGEVKSSGVNGVAAAVHPCGRFLFVANYTSGNVTTLPINADGSLSDATQNLNLPGAPGPHRVEQASSHPHDAIFDPSGRYLIVTDKGLDRVFALLPDEETGALSVGGVAALRPGSGPRHIVFHPTKPRAYVVNEIDSTVTTLGWEPETGRFTPLHAVPGLPDSFFEHSTAAEIAIDPSGRFLYTSNRGADTITRFTVDDAGDSLTLIEWVPSGRDPRYMTLSPDGASLIVANEQSDNIVQFDIDPSSGGLTLAEAIETPSPSVVTFV